MVAGGIPQKQKLTKQEDMVKEYTMIHPWRHIIYDDLKSHFGDFSMERKEDNIWGVILSLQTIERYYENDLGKDNDKLKPYIWEIEKSVEHNKEVDLSQVIEKTKEFWKELITESIEELLKTIESKSGHGGEFAADKIELKKMKEEIAFAELDLRTYEITYEDLKDKREIIKEKALKLDIENKKFWTGLLIGVGLSGIVSFLIALYFFILPLFSLAYQT